MSYLERKKIGKRGSCQLKAHNSSAAACISSNGHFLSSRVFSQVPLLWKRPVLRLLLLVSELLLFLFFFAVCFCCFRGRRRRRRPPSSHAAGGLNFVTRHGRALLLVAVTVVVEAEAEVSASAAASAVFWSGGAKVRLGLRPEAVRLFLYCCRLSKSLSAKTVVDVLVVLRRP